MFLLISGRSVHICDGWWTPCTMHMASFIRIINASGNVVKTSRHFVKAIWRKAIVLFTHLVKRGFTASQYSTLVRRENQYTNILLEAVPKSGLKKLRHFIFEIK
jgi:hypothetical protein